MVTKANIEYTLREGYKSKVYNMVTANMDIGNATIEVELETGLVCRHRTKRPYVKPVGNAKLNLSRCTYSQADCLGEVGEVQNVIPNISKRTLELSGIA